MKKLTVYGIGGIIAVVAIAIATAGRMGETSRAVARGTITLADDLTDAARDVKTLFLIVGHTDSPMPIGAMRKVLKGSPQGDLYEFVLTNESVQRMQPDAPWPPQFKLKARLDRDGAAGPDQPGDLVGELAVVDKGAEGLTIRIDRVVR